MNDQFLRAFPLFDSLDSGELAVIAPYLVEHRLMAGQAIFREGAHGHAVCFVVSGDLVVTKKASDGSEREVTTVSAGQSIGEMALLDGMIRSATVTAKTPVQLLLMSRENFQRLQDEQPVAAMKMLKGLARSLSLNLRKTSSDLTELMLALA